MPTAAALVVKAFDNVTNVTYDVLSKSSGFGQWCTWRQDTGNTNPASARSTFKYRATQTPNGVGHVEVEFRYPFRWTDSTKGIVITAPEAVTFKNGQWHVPQNIDPTFVQQATAQFLNILNHADIRSGFLNQTPFL